jgi:hypothetical protein
MIKQMVEKVYVPLLLKIDLLEKYIKG